MNPIKFSLRHPTVTLVLTAMVLVVGVRAFMEMPRTEDPTITIRTGLVAALYPGATSEQVEKQVTKTLEKHIFKFQEVRKDKTYSTSRPGLVIINVELEDNDGHRMTGRERLTSSGRSCATSCTWPAPRSCRTASRGRWSIPTSGIRSPC